MGVIPIQRITQEETNKVIDELVKQGINFIDTARGYTVSEEYIGNALVGRRDKFYIKFLGTHNHNCASDERRWRPPEWAGSIVRSGGASGIPPPGPIDSIIHKGRSPTERSRERTMHHVSHTPTQNANDQPMKVDYGRPRFGPSMNTSVLPKRSPADRSQNAWSQPRRPTISIPHSKTLINKDDHRRDAERQTPSWNHAGHPPPAPNDHIRMSIVDVHILDRA